MERHSEVKKAQFAQVESQRTKKKERAARQRPPSLEKTPPDKNAEIPGVVKETKVEQPTKNDKKGEED